MLIKLVPAFLKLLFRDLWVELAKGAWEGIQRWWRAARRWFRDLLSFGSKQVGGYVPKTANYLLHQGERVVPASGAGSGTATNGLSAFTGGGKTNLTINTMTMSQDAVPDLGRLLDSELGANGRTTVPIFGDQSVPTSI